MENYDSILKEKKKYKEPTPVKRSWVTKYFIISFLLVLIILVISYVFYYNIILSTKNMFYSNIVKFIDDYRFCLDGVNFNALSDQYTALGDLKINDNSYDYKIVRKDDLFRIDLINGEEIYSNINISDKNYVSLSSFREGYILLEENSYFNLYRSFIKNIQNFAYEEKANKSIYLEGYVPIVSANLVLGKEDVNSLFGTNLIKDDVEVIFTLKNQALTNEIISMKLVFNNKTKNTRDVYNVVGNEISHTNNKGQVTKFVLVKNDTDFKLSIYKGDSLYSVLVGNSLEGNYKYTYQIIDELYTLNLVVKYDFDVIKYEFDSSIAKGEEIEKKSASASFKYQDLGDIDVSDAIDYSNLTKEEQDSFFKTEEEFLKILREFIDYYK